MESADEGEGDPGAPSPALPRIAALAGEGTRTVETAEGRGTEAVKGDDLRPFASGAPQISVAGSICVPFTVIRAPSFPVAVPLTVTGCDCVAVYQVRSGGCVTSSAGPCGST